MNNFFILHILRPLSLEKNWSMSSSKSQITNNAKKGRVETVVLRRTAVDLTPLYKIWLINEKNKIL